MTDCHAIVYPTVLRLWNYFAFFVLVSESDPSCHKKLLRKT